MESIVACQAIMALVSILSRKLAIDRQAMVEVIWREELVDQVKIGLCAWCLGHQVPGFLAVFRHGKWSKACLMAGC